LRVQIRLQPAAGDADKRERQQTSDPTHHMTSASAAFRKSSCHH
jgi:hypothetical protein